MTLLLCSFLTGAAQGAGFAIYEQGAKALGMGGAFAGLADDPSAMFYNPAGIAAFTGKELYAGVSFVIVPARSFSGVNPYPGYGVVAETTSDVFYPPNLYYAHPLKEDLVLGLFLNSPFGLKVEWAQPADFAGRYLSTKAALTPIFFGPVLGWQTSDGKLALGGGLTLAHAKVELNQYLNQTLVGLPTSPVLDIGTVELEASNSVSPGFSIGVMVRPTEHASIGFGFRSSIEVEYDGDAAFTQIMTGNASVDQVVAGLLPASQKAKTTFKFPAQWALGYAMSPNDQWTVAFDLGWTGWSSFDALLLEFEDESLNLLRPQGWEDAFNFRGGAEWRMNPAWALRFGGYWDMNPQPDEAVSPLLPDADRLGLSLGFGYEWSEGKYYIDAYNLAVIFQDRDTNGMNIDNFNGTYRSFANIVGLNFGVRF